MIEKILRQALIPSGKWDNPARNTPSKKLEDFQCRSPI